MKLESGPDGSKFDQRAHICAEVLDTKFSLSAMLLFEREVNLLLYESLWLDVPAGLENPEHCWAQGRAQGLRAQGPGPGPRAQGPRPRAQGPGPKGPGTQGPRPRAQGPGPRAKDPGPRAQGPEPRAQGLGVSEHRPPAQP